MDLALENLLYQSLDKKKRNLFTFLTGAGVSVDSGIQTYRGTDGLWIKGSTLHKPEEFGTYTYFMGHPEEVWQFTLYRMKLFQNAQPNAGHEALVRIEQKLGDRFQLITQNIDGLHLRAGSQRMYEIHGTFRQVKCSGRCKEIRPMPAGVAPKDTDEDLTPSEIEALHCPTCGHWLRPNILWFDEYYDDVTHKLAATLRAAKNTGVLFVLGTSGATGLPQRIVDTTIQFGGHVVDVNLADNEFTHRLESVKNGMLVRKGTTDFLKQLSTFFETAVKP